MVQVRLELTQVLDARRFSTGGESAVEVKRGERADLLQALLHQPWSHHTSLGELVCMLFVLNSGQLDEAKPDSVHVRPHAPDNLTVPRACT
jgi:hypothetical protein